MEVPVWKVLTNTNAPAHRAGVALTASTKPRQVRISFSSYLHVWHLLLYILTIQYLTILIFSPLMQPHLSGVLWMTQHSAVDLAVLRWTEPNTAAVMRAFTWVAPLTTVSVRVSCNYTLLNWPLGGNSAFCYSSSQGSKVSYRAVPSSWHPAQLLLSRENRRCYRCFIAEKIPEYLDLVLLWLIR